MKGNQVPHFDSKKLDKALKSLGFVRTGVNRHGGHTEYVNKDGIYCQCNSRHRSISLIDIGACGNELEKKGIIGRKDFIKLVREA